MRVEGDTERLSPDEAFSVLGNETRVDILRTLGEADEPLSFTELRNRVGLPQGAQFNYHLDRLVDHFVSKTDAGYVLEKPGSRVVEAVLSGALTEDPVLEPTPVDFSCRFCGAQVEVSFRQERVDLFCTECDGEYGRSANTHESILGADCGILGGFPLPPAGVRGRSPDGVLRAASTWGHLEMLSTATDVCPRCTATVEHSIAICESHERSDGLCPHCDRRHAVQRLSRCTNCIYASDGTFGNHLRVAPELRAFVIEHGLDPIADGVRWGWDYEEEILSIDPFAGRFTYAIDGDEITLSVDDDLRVVEVTR